MKILFGLAALAAAASAPAVAQTEAGGQEVVRVAVADLDLGSATGRQALDRRIRTAVHSACGTISSSDPRGSNQVYRCRTELVAKLNQRRDALLASRARSGGLAARR